MSFKKNILIPKVFKLHTKSKVTAMYIGALKMGGFCKVEDLALGGSVTNGSSPYSSYKEWSYHQVIIK